jgi:hypothetical protein
MMKPIALAFALALGTPAAAQQPAGPYEPQARLAAQREAMQALAFLDGTWRGTATGEEIPTTVVHTERVGTLLGGTVRLVEGRAYDAEGQSPFNAFAIISYDPVRRAYSMRSYAMGYAADFPLEVRPDGFSWSRPFGPGVTMRYNSTIRDGEWVEIGERVAEGAPPVRTIELRLRRIGGSDWPQAGAVAPR